MAWPEAAAEEEAAAFPVTWLIVSLQVGTGPARSRRRWERDAAGRSRHAREEGNVELRARTALSTLVSSDGSGASQGLPPLLWYRPPPRAASRRSVGSVWRLAPTAGPGPGPGPGVRVGWGCLGAADRISP